MQYAIFLDLCSEKTGTAKNRTSVHDIDNLDQVIIQMFVVIPTENEYGLGCCPLWRLLAVVACFVNQISVNARRAHGCALTDRKRTPFAIALVGR